MQFEPFTINREPFFEYVGVVGARGYGRDGCQVAAVAAHRLDEEHASLCAVGRLLYVVHHFANLVHRRVRAQGQGGAGHVVADCAGNDADPGRNLICYYFVL